LVVVVGVTNNHIQISWPAGTLQNANEVNGPYIDIDPQPASPYIITPSEAKKFFRVRLGGPGFTYYDTQMLQLDISNGQLPAGMRLRQSPTLGTTGKTAIAPNPDGTFTVSSFFDVFTELSLDNGVTWMASTSAPPHMTFTGVTATNTIPPPQATYISPGQWHALYAQGIVITNASHLGFLATFPPPPSGGVAQTHSFGSTVSLQMRQCPTCALQNISAPATVTVQVTSRP
jgi:hypothetical protein